MCGIVRLKPKTAPEDINIKLFGPGLIEETNAKAINASNKSKVTKILDLDN